MSTQSVNSASSAGSQYDTIIVGGGQAGLAVGYFLKRRNIDFVILDENTRTGSSWRQRWDSLRLFSPSQFDGLPGFPYPAGENYFPTKDELGDYLELYVKRFDLPLRPAVRVELLRPRQSGFEVTAGATRLTAKRVVVATGPYQVPRMPAIAKDLDPSFPQIHSSEYCNPELMPGRRTLIVGAGNSGAEIALELARAGRQVWLAGRDVGILPITRGIGRALGGRPAYWLMQSILNVATPIGQKMRWQMIHRGHPLGRARRQELIHAGVELVGRVMDMQQGKPRLEDGRILEVDSVIWATGFGVDYHWIDMPILDEDGLPKHQRGVVAEAPGLYFVGLPFQSAFNSALLGGVGADAAYIAEQIVRSQAISSQSLGAFER